MESYSIHFFVFRPSGPSLPNCYSLIGTNSLVDAIPNDGRVTLNVPVIEQISVQPGDVVGVLPMSNEADSGIVFNATIDTVTVWFTQASTLVANLGDCVLEAALDGNLPFSGSFAPVITAVVNEWRQGLATRVIFISLPFSTDPIPLPSTTYSFFPSYSPSPSTSVAVGKCIYI